jgi:hypothetical protein
MNTMRNLVFYWYVLSDGARLSFTLHPLRQCIARWCEILFQMKSEVYKYAFGNEDLVIIMTVFLFQTLLINDLVISFCCGNQSILLDLSLDVHLQLLLFCVDTLKDTLMHFIGDTKLITNLTCEVFHWGWSDKILCCFRISILMNLMFGTRFYCFDVIS